MLSNEQQVGSWTLTLIVTELTRVLVVVVKIVSKGVKFYSWLMEL